MAVQNGGSASGYQELFAPLAIPTTASRHAARLVYLCSAALGANARFCRCQLAIDWLISTRWPSGSRRKQRISEPQSCGGVRNAAPLDRSAS
jgi:hypothetical protein